MSRRPLAVPVGDPAGVGPEVSVRASAAVCERDRVVLFGDAARLEALAIVAGVDAARLRRVGAAGPFDLGVGQMGLAHVASWSDEAIVARRPTPDNGLAQLRALDAAVAAVRGDHARAIVTGPTSKEAISLAGEPFVGQTEHLARAAGLADDQVTMMFLGPRLRTALVTTHLAVRAVPGALTEARVARTIEHLAEALVRLDGAGGRMLRLGVTGLNPHAGEGGLFGDEEARVIRPAMDAAMSRGPLRDGPIDLLGPMPAESAFRAAAGGALDGVVAMMHDQATIASKLLDFGQAVNVTWGLPFVRTSVDHGVAYDAAARGTARADGMVAALALACRLTEER